MVKVEFLVYDNDLACHNFVLSQLFMIIMTKKCVYNECGNGFTYYHYMKSFCLVNMIHNFKVQLLLQSFKCNCIYFAAQCIFCEQLFFYSSLKHILRLLKCNCSIFTSKSVFFQFMINRVCAPSVGEI